MTRHRTVTDHSLENEYPKLIRDKIPQIIKQKDGIDVPVRSLSDKEFLLYLLKKILEETQELSRAESDENLKEEIADVYEIIDALVELKKFSKSDIAALQDEKREKRGGFKQRLLMLDKKSADSA